MKNLWFKLGCSCCVQKCRVVVNAERISHLLCDCVLNYLQAASKQLCTNSKIFPHAKDPNKRRAGSVLFHPPDEGSLSSVPADRLAVTSAKRPRCPGVRFLQQEQPLLVPCKSSGRQVFQVQTQFCDQTPPTPDLHRNSPHGRKALNSAFCAEIVLRKETVSTRVSVCTGSSEFPSTERRAKLMSIREVNPFEFRAPRLAS